MINETNEFHYFHAYMDLARQGQVEKLTCPCGQLYVTVLDDEYRLVLWCPVEDYRVYPGLRMLRTVEKEVNKFLGLR